MLIDLNLRRKLIEVLLVEIALYKKLSKYIIFFNGSIWFVEIQWGIRRDNRVIRACAYIVSQQYQLFRQLEALFNTITVISSDLNKAHTSSTGRTL